MVVWGKNRALCTVGGVVGSGCLGMDVSGFVFTGTLAAGPVSERVIPDSVAGWFAGSLVFGARDSEGVGFFVKSLVAIDAGMAGS